MRFLKISIMMLPIVVGGCDFFSDEDSGSFYMPPVTAAPAPAPVTSLPPTTSAGCGCPEKPPAVTPAPLAAPDWHPSEGHLVRAGDLVMELKRSNGGINPSHAAMAAYIQAKMSLTASQAETVLEELGL